MFRRGGALVTKSEWEEILGGVMSAAGFFFYGSLLALFTDERNSSSHVSGAVLFKIPDIGVGHDGGPFSHLVLGHSELHAFIAITAIMGLCLFQRESGNVLKLPGIVLLALPACAVPMHSVASLYCFGVALILLFWGRFNSLRSWVQIVVMFCLFLLAWKTMGFGQAPDALGTRIGLELTQQWWTVATAFLIGLGFRMVGFSWISRSLKDPVSILVLATVVGFMSFFLFGRLQERRGNLRGLLSAEHVEYLCIFALGIRILAQGAAVAIDRGVGSIGGDRDCRHRRVRHTGRGAWLCRRSCSRHRIFSLENAS